MLIKITVIAQKKNDEDPWLHWIKKSEKEPEMYVASALESGRRQQ